MRLPSNAFEFATNVALLTLGLGIAVPLAYAFISIFVFGHYEPSISKIGCFLIITVPCALIALGQSIIIPFTTSFVLCHKASYSRVRMLLLPAALVTGNAAYLLLGYSHIWLLVPTLPIVASLLLYIPKQGLGKAPTRT